MSQTFDLVRDINAYSNDDYEAITVNVNALIEVMTNLYQYEGSKKIIELVKKYNPNKSAYFSFNTFNKLIEIRRKEY